MSTALWLWWLGAAPSEAFETDRAVVHSGDGFCGRATLSVAEGQVTLACVTLSSSRRLLSIRRPIGWSRVLLLPIPMVVAVPRGEREAFEAALRQSGISTAD